MVGGGWLWMVWPWGPVARTVPSGRSSIVHPQRWMQMSWWYWHRSRQCLTLVGPPSFLWVVWWTSETAAGRSQPAGQAQCWSRWMTAWRMAAGIWAEEAAARGALLPWGWLPSRVRRRAEATPPGPETKSIASRASPYRRFSCSGGGSDRAHGGGAGPSDWGCGWPGG